MGQGTTVLGYLSQDPDCGVEHSNGSIISPFLHGKGPQESGRTPIQKKTILLIHVH